MSIAYLILVLVTFGAFMGSLAFVSIWSGRPERKGTGTAAHTLSKGAAASSASSTAPDHGPSKTISRAA